MVTKIYKVSYKAEPTDIVLGDKELECIEFIADFILDYHQTHYYVDEDILNEVLDNMKQEDKEPPAELVNFLREQINKEGDFEFTIG